MSWGSNYDKRVELATRVDDKLGLSEKQRGAIWAVMNSTPEELFDLYIKDNADKAETMRRESRKQELAADLVELAKTNSKFKESDHPRGPGGIFVKAENLKGKVSEGLAAASLARKEGELAALESEFQANVVETAAAMKELSDFQILLGQQPPKYNLISLGDWQTATKGMEDGCARGIAGACSFAPKMRKLTNAIEKGGLVAMNRQNKQAEVAQAKAKLDAVTKKNQARKARRAAPATK